MNRQEMTGPSRAVRALFALRKTNEIDLSSLAHRHDFHQFLYLLQGRCEVRLDDTQYLVRPCQLVTIAPGRMHALAFPSRDEVLCDVFQFKCHISPLADLPVLPEVLDCSRYRQQVEAAFSLMDHAMQQGRTIDVDAAVGGLLSYILAMIGKLPVDGEVTLDPRIRIAVDHVLSNLDSRISVAHLARLCQLDPSYFCRLFSAGMGSSPQVWIASQRMERARNLLMFTTASASAIAEAVAYSSYAHFSNQFLKFYGLRPSEYRDAQIHQESLEKRPSP